MFLWCRLIEWDNEQRRIIAQLRPIIQFSCSEPELWVARKTKLWAGAACETDVSQRSLSLVSFILERLTKIRQRLKSIYHNISNHKKAKTLGSHTSQKNAVW